MQRTLCLYKEGLAHPHRGLVDPMRRALLLCGVPGFALRGHTMVCTCCQCEWCAPHVVYWTCRVACSCLGWCALSQALAVVVPVTGFDYRMP